MKLLISSANEQEATEAIAGGADIIDVKNPLEGSLGASYPWVIKQIKAIKPANVELSCTLGDVLTQTGTMTLAALGAVTTGVDFIKAGLQGVKTKESAIEAMSKIARAVKDHRSDAKVVVVGYADAHRVDSVDPLEVPDIAKRAKLDAAMIDTAVKDGKSTLAFMTSDQLRRFVEESHRSNLEAAIAGSLRKEDLLAIRAVGADIVGLRGAACTNGDRMNGLLRRERVRELAESVHKVPPLADKEF
jgi:hypothetical protein